MLRTLSFNSWVNEKSLKNFKQVIVLSRIYKDQHNSSVENKLEGSKWECRDTIMEAGLRPGPSLGKQWLGKSEVGAFLRKTSLDVIVFNIPIYLHRLSNL